VRISHARGYNHGHLNDQQETIKLGVRSFERTQKSQPETTIDIRGSLRTPPPVFAVPDFLFVAYLISNSSLDKNLAPILDHDQASSCRTWTFFWSGDLWRLPSGFTEGDFVHVLCRKRRNICSGPRIPREYISASKLKQPLQHPTYTMNSYLSDTFSANNAV
jgi:hypothetical protein